MSRLDMMPLESLQEGDELLDTRENRFVHVIAKPEIIDDTIQVTVLYRGNIGTISEPIGSYCSAKRQER